MPNKAYLLFVLFFFPFIDLNITPEEYGSISVFDFISWFTLLYSVKNFFTFPNKLNRAHYIFTVLAVLLFLGSIKSEFVQNSLFNFFKFFSIFIYSKIFIDECREGGDFIRNAIKYLKLGVILSLLFLLIQLIVGVSFTFYPEVNPNVFLDTGVIRNPSFFQDPQKYAQYLSMLSFLFLLNKEGKKRPENTDVFFFIMIVLATLITGSRLAFAGLCCGLLVVIFSMKNNIRFAAVFLCVAGFFVITSFSEYFSFFNREDNYNSSIDTRNQIWKEGLAIFKDNPAFGIGIGNHHDYVVKHTINGYYIIDNEIVYYGTESGYLQLLIEFGLMGFIMVLLIIISPVITAVRSYKRDSLNIVILIAAVLSWIIAFSTVNSLSDKRILVVLASLLCFLSISKSQAKEIHV